MGDDLLIVSRGGAEAMARSLVDAMVAALQPAIRTLVADAVDAHVRAFVDGAARLPQPTFNPPALAPPVRLALAEIPPIIGGEEAPAAPEAPPVTETDAAAATATATATVPPADVQVVEKKYKMGKGAKHKFSDIAWDELPQDEFDLNEAWLLVEPMIEYDSERAPENFRRAIRQDTERFEVSADFRRARKKKPTSTQEVLIGNGL